MKQALAITIFFASVQIKAQADLTYYTYSMYISDAGYEACTEKKTVYFSPIIKHTFEDDYRIFDSQESEGQEIADRWENKVKANYTINKDYCYTSKSEYWESSFVEIDELRDKWINFYKEQGYSVYSKYSFSFR